MFCPACGTENQSHEVRCVKCGESLKQEMPVGPQTLEPPKEGIAVGRSDTNERTVAGSRIARLGDRLLAVILDGMLIAAVFAFLGSWVAVRWGGLTETGFSMTGTPALITFGLTAAFAFLYYWFLEGLLGATLGKLVLGIKVRDISGAPCTLYQSFIRNILRIVDFIGVYLLGFLIAIFSKLRQRLGDHVAKTVVIEKAPGKVLRVLLVLIWLAAIVCSVWWAYVIHRGTPVVTPAAVTGTVAQKAAGTPLQAGAINTSGQLKIVDFRFTEGEKGPVRAAVPYKLKDKVFAQYNIIGYTTDEQGQINLEGHVTVIDPQNITASDGNFTIKQKIANNEPAWGFVKYSVVEYSPPGTHKIHIRIHDAIKNTDVEYIAPFNVNAPPPVIAKGLDLRDLQLSLTEDGPPVSYPIIQAGGKVYTSAKLAGMQFKDNSVHVKIAFKLIGPRGELVLNKQDFLEIKDSWDYRPSSFFLPITANVSPPSGMKGIFTEQFQVMDMYGNNSRMYSAKFEVK